ncbi:MAG: Rpn family recombination-promoting nuclease/putative transposase, partial [Planctomycetaceae bacterium]|nr:Rpn family recombination-promoting nuclease/putative transposase [Planctomycetaceae bacterium]
MNKELLIDFLNSLLPPYHQISNLTFRNPDTLGLSVSERRAIFDIFCESEKKESFIIEMQKAEQLNFKDRSVYYAARPIVNQGLQGDWDYKLKAVYFIVILDFLYDKDPNTESFLIR